MATAAANVAATIAGLSDADQQLSIRNYVIDHVSSGGSGATTDGATAVFLNINGDVVQSSYLDSLTSPIAGQTVRVLIVNNSPTILGRPIGLPAI